MTANKLVNVSVIEWRIFERFLPNVDGVEFGMSGVSGLVIQNKVPPSCQYIGEVSLELREFHPLRPRRAIGPGTPYSGLATYTSR